jgi:hypothetical protein
MEQPRRIEISRNGPDTLVIFYHLIYFSKSKFETSPLVGTLCHKMSGVLCHGLCVGGVGVRKHLVSISYWTNACVD